MNFVEIASAIMQRLEPAGAPADQPYGWTIGQAVEQISHIKISPAETREVIAYLALQLHRAQYRDGENERAVLNRVRSVITEYDEQLARARQESAA